MSLTILIHSQYAEHTTLTEQHFLNFYITFLQSSVHTHQSVIHAPQLFYSSLYLIIGSDDGVLQWYSKVQSSGFGLCFGGI